MKRKIILILLFLTSILLIGAGCESNNLTAKEAVRDYLEKYITLDSSVLKQLDEYTDKENFTDVQKNTYKDILKKQYSSLSYSFIDERYEENTAYITTKIEVLDLVNVQNEAAKYLNDNSAEFNNDEGKYDKNKFLDYKLDLMSGVTKTIEYEIEFKVLKEGNNWVVSQLSNDDLLKIHGAYEKE